MTVFERVRPDVLLSDIAMPVEDGYSLIGRVRERERSLGWDRCFAAAFTAYAGDTDRARALELGYDLHLAKPIEPGELVQRLSRGLAGRARCSA
jgi:CheY-like chemotaxis protein